MDLRSDDGLIATQLRGPPGGRRPQPDLRVSRYDINRVEIYHSARKHNVDDADIVHAVERAVAIGERDDGAVLYLGPDRAGNLLEVVAVARDDGSEIVIHAMKMRRRYSGFLPGRGARG